MRNKILYYLGGLLVRCYTTLMLEVDTVFEHPIPKGGKIIVANHPTTSDPFIISSMSKGQGSVLIKDVLFNVPLFGRYLRWAGHVPVAEGKGHITFLTALAILKRNISIINFIEGDISNNQKPKTGAVRMAILTGKPLVPIGIAVKKEHIKHIASQVKGKQEVGLWYLWGPYAMTVGTPYTISGDVKNRDFVRKQTGLLMEKITFLTQKSKTRIEEASYSR